MSLRNEEVSKIHNTFSKNTSELSFYSIRESDLKEERSETEASQGMSDYPVSTTQRCEYSRVLPYVYTDKLHTKISVLVCGGNFRTWDPKEVLVS